MSNTSKVGEFCWNELATTNIQAAKDFYGNVFGWKFSDIEVGDGMTYTLINRGNDSFSGIWTIPKDKAKEIPPHWMSYILVEDADAALAKALKHGATMVKPVTQAGEMGRLAIIVDPTGAHIAMWQSLGK